MWNHLRNSLVIEENHHQNNVITERLHQQLNVSTQFDGIKANFLRLCSSNVGILGRDMWRYVLFKTCRFVVGPKSKFSSMSPVSCLKKENNSKLGLNGSSIGVTLAFLTSLPVQDGGPHDFRSKMAAPMTPRWRPPRNQDGGPCDAFGYTSEGESTP